MGGNVARTVHETHLKETEQRAQLEDFGLCGRLKLVADVGFHVVDSGFCEEGDEIPCYVKCGDSLD
jgi:hypothetical protein